VVVVDFVDFGDVEAVVVVFVVFGVEWPPPCVAVDAPCVVVFGPAADPWPCAGEVFGPCAD